MSVDYDELDPNDIAIIGMALRVPGAKNTAEFWNNLKSGTESIRTYSREELIEGGESPELVQRRNYIPRAAELPNMEMFDADFFGFNPKEAAIMDPQHRQFLECAWEAFEDGLRPPNAVDGPVGVFAGCGMGSYFYFNVCSHQSLRDQVGMFLLRHTGNDKDFLSTRASYLFDLHGPSVNVQTACSTSLVAVHYACQSLLNDECEMAVAGGVTIELPHRRGYLFQDGEILSPDGHCRAFDHRAAGTVFGSGVGTVVLRRLGDAIADGDPVRAVIKATAINNDGASKAGYLAPSVTGQAEAVVEALALAGVAAQTVQYVECHGTGTFLGDPIEVAALTQAYRQSTDRTGFCRIGSVKSNIGHLDTAAGVVSLIKAALSVEHGEIPPTLGFDEPNPNIPFESSPFVVNDKLTPWPDTDTPRRAGVNSLGVGGTNAHAIIEAAPEREVPPSAAEHSPSPQLISLTAKSVGALDGLARNLSTHLTEHPSLSLEDVAYSLVECRQQFEHRSLVAVENREDAISVLSDPKSRRIQTVSAIGSENDAVFLFPGGGAQYPGMARNLYKSDAKFAAIVDQGLSFLPPPVAGEIRTLWFGDGLTAAGAAERFLVPSLQLPAILILEVALARTLTRNGITPKALMGHSMGQNAAACVAEVISFEHSVKLVHLRGMLFDEVTGGGMLSISQPAEDVIARLPDTLDIAAINAPDLCVVSGPDELLAEFSAALAADDIDATRVSIDVAAHSRMLDPILERFGAFLRDIPLSPPAIPIISNVSGSWLRDEEATDPNYWVTHLRSTVRFSDGMATLSDVASRVYVETGPGRIMSSLAKAQGNIKPGQLINCLPHADEDVDDRLHFLTSVGQAWCAGLPVTHSVLPIGDERRRVPLPLYPFQHQRFFIDAAEPTSRSGDLKPLIKEPDIARWGWRPTWKPAYADTTVNANNERSSFLVFLDDGGCGERLVEQLLAQGNVVKTVSLGDNFGIAGDDRYTLCPEQGREGYDALVADLVANGGVPEKIVHLWLVTTDENFRPGSSFFNRNQERGFYSLFFLAQALENSGSSDDVQLTVLTNGMQCVGEEHTPYPEKATVLGPAQVIPKEMENISVRVIDVPLETQPSAQASSTRQLSQKLKRILKMQAGQADDKLILEDLFANNGTELVAYRDGKRWVQTHERLSLEDDCSAENMQFRKGGVYLLTGGLGDLALACAEQIVELYEARIVLIGRAVLPEREGWSDYISAYGETDRIGKAIAAIQRMETAGGAVHYIRADVTNPQTMRRAFEDANMRFGKLNGVLHTAGIVKDDLIQLKTPSDIEDVLAPKVLGTIVLDELIEGQDLDFLALFSSTSTDTTPAGQVDYVGANAFLNAYAESRQSGSSPHTVAVHWGVWNEIGLAARAIKSNGHDQALTSVIPARQPLFDRRVEVDGKSDRVELRCETSRQWMLDEHRLVTGEALWPGTGYLELIVEAAREFGIRGACEVDELIFLRPLHVPDDEARNLAVSASRTGDGLKLIVESRVEMEAGSEWITHAQATVVPMINAAPIDRDLNTLLQSCGPETQYDNGKPLRTDQEDHLKFGPRWRVLRKVFMSQKNRCALAQLSLEDSFHDDLRSGLVLHPALMDIATGYAMGLIDGYDPEDGLWVPATYGRIRIHSALPAEIYSRVVLNEKNDFGDGFATFDVEIFDKQGRCLIEIERFTVKHLDKHTNFVESLHERASATQEPQQRTEVGEELSPALLRLAAQVEQGIKPAEGIEALRRALASGLPQVIVSSLDLAGLKQSTFVDQNAASPAGFTQRPTVDSTYAAPKTETETKIAEFWSELLGIDQVGIDDSFFDLGGHSLIAVRLFRMIRQTFSVDLPISVLFEAPTISQCAVLIEQAGGAAVSESDEVVLAPNAEASTVRNTHLVQMQTGKTLGQNPFFVCAGMFGNILNLRYLANQIGQDRPVFGLQARGLYGDKDPHETFEDMARDYLVEVVAAQPHGPYLLGGFSGGGLVAYEMAQQLNAAGEEVAIVVLLDTPYPEEVELSVADRAAMKMQDLRHEKGNFLGTWARERIAWEVQKRRGGSPSEALTSEQFHNDAIEAAFRRALGRYEADTYDAKVLLLRPKLQIAYHLSGERNLNKDRCIVRPDNGWSNYIKNLQILEVPGDHDGMVLEPNVRVLSGYLRAALEDAENASSAFLSAAE